MSNEKVEIDTEEVQKPSEIIDEMEEEKQEEKQEEKEADNNVGDEDPPIISITNSDEGKPEAENPIPKDLNEHPKAENPKPEDLNEHPKAENPKADDLVEQVEQPEQQTEKNQPKGFYDGTGVWYPSSKSFQTNSFI